MSCRSLSWKLRGNHVGVVGNVDCQELAKLISGASRLNV